MHGQNHIKHIVHGGWVEGVWIVNVTRVDFHLTISCSYGSDCIHQVVGRRFIGAISRIEHVYSVFFD